MLNKRFFNSLLRFGIYGVLGKPRAGKTSLDAAVAAENARRKIKCKKWLNSANKFKRFIGRVLKLFRPYFETVYCTDATIQNAVFIDYKNFGLWNVPDYSLIILEEAGVGFDNRSWSSFKDYQKRLCAYIGHKKSTILWCSQTADIDKTLRVRTHKIFMVNKFLGHLSLIRPIDYEFGVDNEKGEMRDIYHTPKGIAVIASFLRRETWFFYRKPYYKYFDSFEDTYHYKIPDPAKQEQS